MSSAATGLLQGVVSTVTAGITLYAIWSGRRWAKITSTVLVVASAGMVIAGAAVVATTAAT